MNRREVIGLPLALGMATMISATPKRALGQSNDLIEEVLASRLWAEEISTYERLSRLAFMMRSLRIVYEPTDHSGDTEYYSRYFQLLTQTFGDSVNARFAEHRELSVTYISGNIDDLIGALAQRAEKTRGAYEKWLESLGVPIESPFSLDLQRAQVLFAGLFLASTGSENIEAELEKEEGDCWFYPFCFLF